MYYCVLLLVKLFLQVPTPLPSVSAPRKLSTEHRQQAASAKPETPSTRNKLTSAVKVTEHCYLLYTLVVTLEFVLWCGKLHYKKEGKEKRDYIMCFSR